MQVNSAGTTRPIPHLEKPMNPASWLMKMEKDDKEITFCVKFVNLVVFSNGKRDFNVKYTNLWINVALE